ncbi:phosphoglycerate kinase [Candidatus Gottesmanbacteria bacterium RBG_16_37_8]|uniref:Phosphoglycerate kinase n=1 Tax=Candidatus Gottesmanbacteria bacterium RBG_16_37_8 TaxID=1798371 RepID=A0A1F5YPW2_9BACT|nr:MAG: phosphoglycerate kinase [Candidatus Gottesmanbacteria bacterium RBG_16_37_8]
MNKKVITKVTDIEGKRVFITCDFNISLINGAIANDTRIRAVVPTIKYLLAKNCRLILASHLGRPKGHDLNLSLKPVAEKLAILLKKKVELVDYYWKEQALSKIKNISSDKIILLENIRYCPAEKTNDPLFSSHLAKMADIFVNEAFGASHRIHASIVGIAQIIPGYAGLLLKKEIEMLEKALLNPQRPFLVFIGGAKTPEKISVIEKLLDIADTVALGGAIANTFLAAWGFGMGQSLVDYEMVEMARTVFWHTTRKHTALFLPVDVVIQNNNLKNKPHVVYYDRVPSDVAIYDIGPKTNLLYKKLINSAKTVIWNGPMGLYENPLFKKGTDLLLKDIVKARAYKIIGGGNTLSFLANKKIVSSFNHVSTGGSAMLEYMKAGSLPGIEVLQNQE